MFGRRVFSHPTQNCLRTGHVALEASLTSCSRNDVLQEVPGNRHVCDTSVRVARRSPLLNPSLPKPRDCPSLQGLDDNARVPYGTVVVSTYLVTDPL